MAINSKSIRKDNSGAKTRNPRPKRADQAQDDNSDVKEGTTYHTSSNGQPTTIPADDEPLATSTEPPCRGRGRPKKTVVDQQSDSTGQEPAPAKVVAPRKRG